MFDTVYTPRVYNDKLSLINNLKRADFSKTMPSNLLRRLLFLEDQSVYFNYFNNLWLQNEKTSIVGDITPSYSGLSSDHFGAIKRGLENLDFKVKIIFLMRDPVERIWSAIRMTKRKNQSFNEFADELLINQTYTTYKCEIRTRYDLTIKNLEKVFNKEDVFYCLYEELFSVKSINKMTSFLGVNAERFDSKEYHNVSEKSNLLSDSISREVAKHYSSVYHFVDNRFSIRDLWNSSRFVLD